MIADCASSLTLPDQRGFEDKLGGLPWGLPAEKWPLCKHCRKPMTHLLQVQHHPRHLDLGADDLVLFGFQCDWQGMHLFPEGAEMRGGAETSLFVLRFQDLGEGLTLPPEPGATVFPEARVVRWREEDPPTPRSARNPPIVPEVPPPPVRARRWWHFWRKPAPQFPRPELRQVEPERDTPDGPCLDTRIGTPLLWLTEPLEVPPGFRYLGQLCPRMRFQGPKPEGVRLDNHIPWPRYHGRFEAPAVGWLEPDGWGCWMFEPWHDWGTGLGYMFLNEERRGLVVWQWRDVMSCQAPRLTQVWTV